MAKPTRDWNARYLSGDIPWNTERPCSELRRVLAEKWFSPCRALEIGCGTGTNAVFLAEQGYEMTAVDISSHAIEQGERKAKAAGASVDFRVVDLLDPPDLGAPFDFVFDRGVYHAVRRISVEGFQAALDKVIAPGSWYLAIAGNANQQMPEGKGPPRVTAEEICRELTPLLRLVQLREIRFDEVTIGGKSERPLAWSALFQRGEAG